MTTQKNNHKKIIIVNQNTITTPPIKTETMEFNPYRLSVFLKAKIIKQI